MTKAQIEARLEQLTQQRAQLQQTLLAYDGAIQDCQYWLTTVIESVDPVSDGDSTPSNVLRPPFGTKEYKE